MQTADIQAADSQPAKLPILKPAFKKDSYEFIRKSEGFAPYFCKKGGGGTSYLTKASFRRMVDEGRMTGHENAS